MNNWNFSTYDKIQEQLDLENIYFQQLFDNSPQGIIILSQDFKIIMANESFCNLFKYEMAEIIGKNIDDLIVPDEFYNEATSLTKKAADGVFIKKEVLRTTKDGVLKYCSVIAYPILRKNTQIANYAIYEDISKKKQHEERLKLFASVLENNTEGVIITDEHKKITWVNRAFTNITGYNLEEVEGKKPNILQSGMHSKSFYEKMWASIISKGYWKGEIWNKDKYHKVYPQRLNIFSIGDEGNPSSIVGIITDITKEKDKEEKIIQLAYRDNLTGLHNRISFNEILTKAIIKAKKNQRKMALLFLDLNGFKKINDNLGHSMGDNLLQVIANNLNLALGEDVIVARIGGDEFTVLLENYSQTDEVIKVAEKIANTFDSPWIFDNHTFYLSTSIGIALYPDHGQDSDTLISSADMAMYRAKENRNHSKHIFYDPLISEKTQEEYTIENNLRNAIRKREFVIHYQPIVDMKTKNIVAVEALLRWDNKSDLGIVCPNKFIPIAEKCGLIIPIGEYVLREACMQNVQWQNQGLPPINIAVNISIRQLQQRDFLYILSNILKETKMDGKYLILEISENFFIKDIKDTLPLLEGLKSLGVRISIDDFGTGLSCLSKLASFDIESLKIDENLINDINGKENSTNIVPAIVSLAKCINLKVIAESVDSDKQLNLLKEYGCDMMQGHLLSPPLSSHSFEQLLKDRISLD